MTGDLTIQRGLGDLTFLTLKQENTSSDLVAQKSFIDFTFVDSNSNETPQVRIGAEVGNNDGSASSQAEEGMGAFVVYTNNADTDAGAAGTSLAERFRVDRLGNVGIGTTSPAQKLEVSFAASVYGARFTRNDANGSSLIEFANSTGVKNITGYDAGYDGYKIGTTTATNLIVKPNSNVGINTTSPSYKLDVSGTVRVAQTLHLNGQASGYSTGFNGSTIYSAASTFASEADMYGALVLQSRSDGVNRPILFVNGATPSEKMRITPGGYIGIGTTAPNNELEILGSNSPRISLRTSSETVGEALELGFQVGTGLNASSNTVGLIKSVITQANPSSLIGDLEFQTNTGDSASTKMIIKGNGNVGIGTTSPAYKLDVAGDIYISNGESLYLGNANSRISSNSSSDILYFPNRDHVFGSVISGADIERVRITEAGNVGIGTTSPSSKLEIRSESADHRLVSINRPASDTAALYLGNDSATPANAVISSNYSDLILGRDQSGVLTEHLRIKRDGNVGIGTTSPSEKLHVSGNVRIEGDLTVNGSYTQIDTDVNTTEQWNVTNDGTGPAVTINQTGAQDIMDVQDDGTSVFYIEDGGNVGIGTTAPDHALHVKSAATGDASNIKIESTSQYGGLAFYENTANRGTLAFGDNNNIFTGALTNSLSLRSEAALHLGAGGNNLAITIATDGNVGIGTATPAAKLSVSGAILAGGKYSYRKGYGSLDTTGAAVAGLSSASNGASAMFKFEMNGGLGHYQKVVYSCYNAGGNWFANKVIDEGTNELDVEASANNNTTITFTFKARNSTQSYSPAVEIEASGAAINTTYL
jgi:hypothetical protein